MCKRYSIDNADWIVYDSARDTYNETENDLRWNLATDEGTGRPIDLLSNGFKIKSDTKHLNTSGEDYIYAAFAEHPFKTARAR